MSTPTTLTFFDNRTTTALAAIRPLIEGAERIDVGMAFLSAGGWRRLRDALTAFVERGGRLRVVLRRDRWRTSVWAVSALLALPNAEVRFHPDPHFHPKRLNVHRSDALAVVLGSANLTVGGLETNPEDGVILALDPTSPEGRQASRVFETWWRESTPVTEAELQRLKAERGQKSTTDPATQRQEYLRQARRLFERAQATQDVEQRRRWVAEAEALLARAERLGNSRGEEKRR